MRTYDDYLDDPDREFDRAQAEHDNQEPRDSDEDDEACESCGRIEFRDDMTYARESHHPDAPGAWFCGRCI